VTARAESNSSPSHLAKLNDAAAVRERCGMVHRWVADGRSPHFTLEESRLPTVAAYVADVIRDAYPDLNIPYHSRWRHFATGGVERWGELAARIDADLYFPLHVKTLYENFRVDSGEKIEGHDTYLVVGRSETQPPLRLCFDKESGLLLRLIRYAETPLGRNPTQIDYADYRDANGLKVPFRWTLSRPGNQFTIQVEQLQQNVPVDDARFAAPPPPTTAQKPPAP